jgi:hypothetical protein
MPPASGYIPPTPTRIPLFDIRMPYFPDTLACDLPIAVAAIPNLRGQTPLTTVNRETAIGVVI